MAKSEEQDGIRSEGNRGSWSAAAPAERARILAVDDNEANLCALQALLEHVDAELVMARTGVEALRQLMDEDFALILLDVRMPGQSGFDVARLVRARPRSSHIPIIFLTASEQSQRDLLEGYQLGAVDFLFKPIVSEILLSKVNVFLELHRQTQNVKRQAELLRQAERREHEHHMAELQKRLEEERLLAEIERERRISSERDQAIRARDEFISIASHELRTPLTPLTLRVQSIRQAIEQSDTDQLLEAATKIEGYVRRLTRLVDTLLDISRVTHGRLQLQFAEVDLRELLNEVIVSLEGEAARAGSAVTLQAADGIHGRWDRLRLEQIFVNLLGNAIKYGLGKPIEIRVAQSAGLVEVAVSDGGIGIPLRDQARVFERFERAVPTTHFGGFGLGLWIVRHLVEAHGGTIRLESVLGHGTTVLVQLPLNS